jgi:hypothetical protein
VPVSLLLKGLSKSAAKVFTVPVCVPVAVGVKVTEIVQLPFPAMLPPQVFVSLYGPLMETLPMVTAADVELLIVIVLAGLVVPTFCAAKVKLVGLNVSADADPVRFTTCGLPGPLVVT